MNRRTAFTLTTIALLCITVALPSDDAAAQQKTLKEQLAGIWTYISSEITLPNGAKQPSLFGGANAKGILILDASGRYADIEMRPDRPKFKASANIRLDTSDAEFGAAAKGFGANFGTWSVNEADKTLIRQYEGALIPNNERNEAKDSVSLAGDELKLVGPAGASVLTEVLHRAK
jgi:Lipocalin-like domain